MSFLANSLLPSEQRKIPNLSSFGMPTALTRVAVRLRDSLDEFIERMEDGEAGRRDKYGRKTQLWHDHEYQRKRRLRRHRSKIEVSERLKRINNDSELNATMHGALNTLEEPEGGSRDGPLGERGFAQRGQQTGSGEHGRIAFREDNGGGESQIFTRDGTHSAFPGRGGSLVYPSSRERRDSSGGGDNSRGGPRRGSRQYLYHNHSSHDTNVEVAHQSRNPKPLPQSQFALEGEFVDPPPITVDQEVKEKRVRFAGLQESRLRQPSVEESIPEEPELDREHHDERHSGEPKTTAPAHLMRPEPYLEETNSEYLSEAGLQDVDHALVDGSQPSPEERRKEVQSPAAGLSQRPPRVEQYQHNISPMPSMGSMTDRVNEVSVKKADANAKSAKRNFDGADTDTESPKLMEPLESQNMNATAISLATDDSISAEQFPALRLRGGGKDERSHSSSGEPHGGKFGNEDKYHDHEDFDDEYTGEEVEAHILHSSGHSESYVFERDRRTYGSVGTGKFSTKASPVERERRAYGGIHGERFSTAAFPKQPKAKGVNHPYERPACYLGALTLNCFQVRARGRKIKLKVEILIFCLIGAHLPQGMGLLQGLSEKTIGKDRDIQAKCGLKILSHDDNHRIGVKVYLCTKRNLVHSVSEVVLEVYIISTHPGI
ncbi:MAG: hypothetical protein LQ351_005263 [Letrouitia transgressa]|nr:MAG: hypothetical protein LQ351_005263 [Letrouitia transgressa]